MCCKRTAQFPCAIGVLLGVLLLLAGTIVILIWAFVPKFSQTYPVGLQVGAVTCGFGVLLVICGLIGIYRWHARISQVAKKQTSSARGKHPIQNLTNAHECYIATPSSFSLTGSEALGGLKKAHSTAYISVGSVQAEKIKVLSLVHGFISTTDLRHPLRAASASLKNSTAHSQSNGILRDPSTNPVQRANTSAVLPGANSTHVAVATQCYKRFTGEKSLRRSLPRVLVHPPLMRPTQESHSQTNLSEASGEGLQLEADDLKRSTRNVSSDQDDDATHAKTEAKQSVSSRHSNREVNFSQPDAHVKPKRQLTRVLTTPPIGRASLFNLASPDCVSTSVWMNTGGGTLNGSIPNNRTAHESGASLDRTNSGKRVLLMNQTGQVISCTTLFGEELDMEPASSGSAGGVGCRRLQACQGWNFFPVFVERDRFVSDEELGKSTTPLSATNHNQSVNVSEGGLSFANSDIDCSGTYMNVSEGGLATRRSLRRNHSSVLNRIRSFFKRFRLFMPGSGRAARGNSSNQLSDVEAVEVASGERGSLISNPMSPNSEQTAPEFLNHGAQCATSHRLISDSDATVCARIDSARPAHHSTGAKDELINGEDSIGNSRSSQIQDVLDNNASVFSLPAISPDLWTADRPVWIMGVPVADNTDQHHWLAAMDACDVILLRERQESDCGQGTVTGSSSSVYAFHVRPPSRLRPRGPTTANSHTRSTGAARSHGRARSLGRILFSDKPSVQS